MKLFNAIAAAAVIGASFINPAPVEARNGWINVGCGTGRNNQRGCMYYRVIKRNTPLVTVEKKETFPHDLMYDNNLDMDRLLTVLVEIDCNRWRHRVRIQLSDRGWQPWKSWTDILPGTIGEGGAEAVC